MRVGFNRQLKRARFHRHSCVDDSEERSIRKASARLSPLFALFWKTCTSPTNDTIPANPWLGRSRSTSRSWSATRPARRSAIFHFDDQPSPTIDPDRLTTDEARPHGSDLRQLPGLLRRSPPI